MTKTTNFEQLIQSNSETLEFPVSWTLEDISDSTYHLESGSLIVTNNIKTLRVDNFNSEQIDNILTGDGKLVSFDFVSDFIENQNLEFAASAQVNAKPIGKIMEVSGKAYAINGGAKIEIKAGMNVYKGTSIETSKNTNVELKMEDNSIVKLGESTRMSLSDFYFDESSAVGKTILSIFKGIFAFSSGLIARDEPANVKIKTPVAEIGLRGTKLAGKIDSEGESYFTLIEGRVLVTNYDGSQELSTSWQTAYVPSNNQLIIRLEKPADFLNKFKSAFSSQSDLQDFMLEGQGANQPRSNPQSRQSDESLVVDDTYSAAIDASQDASPFLINPYLKETFDPAQTNTTDQFSLTNSQDSDLGFMGLIESFENLFKKLVEEIFKKVTEKQSGQTDTSNNPDKNEDPIITDPEDLVVSKEDTEIISSIWPLTTRDAGNGSIDIYFSASETGSSGAKYPVWGNFTLKETSAGKYEWQLAGLSVNNMKLAPATLSNFEEVLKKYFPSLTANDMKTFIDNLHTNTGSDNNNLGNDYYIAAPSTSSGTVFGSYEDATQAGVAENDSISIKHLPLSKTATIHMNANLDMAVLRAGGEEIINAYFLDVPVTPNTPQGSILNGNTLEIRQEAGSSVANDVLNLHFVYDTSDLVSNSVLFLKDFLTEFDITLIKDLNIIIEVKGSALSGQTLGIQLERGDNIIDKFFNQASNNSITITEKINGSSVSAELEAIPAYNSNSTNHSNAQVFGPNPPAFQLIDKFIVDSP